MNSQSSNHVRVLHFARFINRYDFMDTVIRFADAQRFRMMACTLTDQSTIESPRYEHGGISHWVLGCDSRRRYPLAIFRLARLLMRFRVDILHTHHYEETLIGVLAATIARTPRVIIGRHYHDELYLMATGFKLQKLLALEAFCNWIASIIVVPSTLVRQLLVEKQGVPQEKVKVVPYGFDFAADHYLGVGDGAARSLRRQLDLNDSFVVGNFGRHTALKGQDYLLQGFSRLVKDIPNARLLMVGDGPHHSVLRAMAKNLRISDSVIFTGWRRDVVNLMSVVDVVVHPTLLDSFPQVMIEALIFGKPLIVTDAAGPHDQIQHGQTGLLIPMRDSDAIYRELHWVFSNTDEARRLGEQGRRYVLDELDIKKGIKRYEACYDAVLATSN